MIEKIKLTKKYEFAPFYSILLILIIDFKDKSVYYQYPVKKDKFKKEDFCISTEAYDIYRNSYDIFFKDKLNLSEDKIKCFLNDLNKLNLSNDINFSKTHEIDNLYIYEVEIYSQNDKETFKRLNYTEDWNQFENILTDLIGFNFFDSKNIITDYDFDIKSEGIYLNSNKLKLTKLYYHYFVSVAVIKKDFAINFDKKTVKGSNSLKFSEGTFSISLSDIQISQLLSIIEKYGVYKWCNIDYYQRLTSKTEDFWLTFDGYEYFIELIFDNKYVLVSAGHCSHPDTYYNFGKEFKELLGVDLFNISEISDDEKEEYLLWAQKHCKK